MARAKSLEQYRAKRDFARTPEPAGKAASTRKATSKQLRFVVQKHDATRLHWDFRLELDGVLKSWAVTRGPSPDPADKRLAVRTEDHPLDYATFEGVIPAGEYGGGTVMLWDEGTWEPVPGKNADNLAQGHLHFVLHGKRMKGEWLLIRLKPRGREKRENWLLRKIEDGHTGAPDSLVERGLTSISTSRTMQEIAAGMRPRHRSGKPPRFEPLQLATLVDEVPEGPDWLHETKYDGYRILISIGGEDGRVYTRSGRDWTERFPSLVAAALDLPVDEALIDGEIVALDEKGNPDFSALQTILAEPDPAIRFFAFDLLQLDGEDLRPLPNLERKERLRALLGDAPPPFHYAEHVLGSGEVLLHALCGAELEGVVSKRIDAPYRGRRTQAWVKTKCIARQEFVVIGWTDSPARARPFGALLLALHDGDELRYAGKVGTGFDADGLEQIYRALEPLCVDSPPVRVPGSARRGAHWVRPELVAEVAYAELTADGIVRHGRFMGLREDKPAAKVRRERPRPAPAEPDVVISSPERVVFPGAGITKGELAQYYTRLAPLVLTTLAGRPLSLVRCPDGLSGKCFFQKHGAGKLGKDIGEVSIPDKEGTMHEYLCLSDSRGLLECVQMGAIEFHAWGCHSRQLERPDRLIFDLDPDAAIGFTEVRKAAEALKHHLADMGLTSFAMLSGGKGVHVIVPVRPERGWPETTDFCRRFATALAEAEPDRFVATMSKARRKGRIFIDWLRNQRGSTAVVPYSARARAGAPVAAPVSWSELDQFESATAFTLRDADLLLTRAHGDQLAGWGRAEQSLPAI